jgi:hypothetical protein
MRLSKLLIESDTLLEPDQCRVFAAFGQSRLVRPELNWHSFVAVGRSEFLKCKRWGRPPQVAHIRLAASINLTDAGW